MTKRSAFPMVGTVGAIMAIAVLLVAFTLPNCYLRRMTSVMRAEANDAELAILYGDMDRALENINAMSKEYEKRQDNLKLFFHHDDLDDMQKALKTCRDLAAMGESDNLICELNDVFRILEHMESVEGVTIYEIF